MPALLGYDEYWVENVLNTLIKINFFFPMMFFSSMWVFPWFFIYTVLFSQQWPFLNIILSLCSLCSPCSDFTRHHQPIHGSRYYTRGVKYSLKASIPGLGSATRTDVSTHECVDMPTEKPIPGDRRGSWLSQLGAPGMSPTLATYGMYDPR